MNDELEKRIRRIYSAIGETTETDLSKFQPLVSTSENRISVTHDFRGGLTDEQIGNIAHSAIHNIANLKDHLRRWARKEGKDPDTVEAAVKQSLELQVIIDLSNVDKHGYPPRDDGFSGRAPKLEGVKRIMRLSTGNEPDSASGVIFTPLPVAQVSGSGSANVVITGDIVDKNGGVVGDLHDFLQKAAGTWERLLVALGVQP